MSVIERETCKRKIEFCLKKRTLNKKIYIFVGKSEEMLQAEPGVF